jgi:hypothetical protein
MWKKTEHGGRSRVTSPGSSSPRQAALDAIEEVRAARSRATLDLVAWDKLVTIAWENRAQTRDRREVQRDLRQVLLEASVKGSLDATS